MKLFFLLPLLVFSKEIEKLLSFHNKDLENFNSNLHKQLQTISKNFISQIQEDYYYNKQRMNSLVSEYEKEPDSLAKIFLAEEIQQYLIGIVEDANLLEGKIEGISSKNVVTVLQNLKKNIRIGKEKYFAKESAGFYNELNLVLIQKNEVVQELQLENAKLYGKIESKMAEIKEISRNLEKDSKKYDEKAEEIKKLRNNYNVQTIELESSISNQKTIKINSLRQEDDKILELQTKSSEKSLIIEKLTAEVSILSSKHRFLTDSLERYSTELDTKSLQLAQSHEKFEEFSAAVRKETLFQVSDITNSENSLENERKDLDLKEKALVSEYNQCKSQTNTLISLLKSKSIMIDENSKDLKETQNRHNKALEQRDKEVDNLAIKYEEYQTRIQEYQKNLDDTLGKLSEKATIIQDLQDKLRNNHKDDFKQSYFWNDKNI